MSDLSAVQWEPQNETREFLRKDVQIPWMWGFGALAFAAGAYWRIMIKLDLDGRHPRSFSTASTDGVFLTAVAVTCVFVWLAWKAIERSWTKPLARLVLDATARRILVEHGRSLDGPQPPSRIVLDLNEVQSFVHGSQKVVVHHVNKYQGAVIGEHHTQHFLYRLAALPQGIVVFQHRDAGVVNQAAAALEAAGCNVTRLT